MKRQADGEQAMSQKKVEAYKEYKKNRDKILEKEKRNSRIRVGIAGLIAVAFIGWFGFSIYNSATRPDPAEAGTVTPVEMDVQEYTDYINGLDLTY